MIKFYQKYKAKIKITLLILVIGFITQFIVNTDLSVIKLYLSQMPLTFVGILILSFLAYLCATWAWRLCLGDDEQKTSLIRLFVIRHVGEMLSVFNPTSIIAGEALKAHFLSKNGVSNASCISSILVSRILIILSAILLSLFSALYLLINMSTGIANISLLGIGVVVIGGFGYLLARFLLHSKLYLYTFVNALQARFGEKFITNDFCNDAKKINSSAQLFYSNNKSKFYAAFFLSILHWIFGAAEFYIILKAININLSPINAIAIEME